MTDNKIYLTQDEQKEIMLNAVTRVMWEKYDGKGVAISEDVFKAASYALEETWEKMNEKLNEQMTDSAKDANPTETDPYKLFIVTESKLSDDEVKKMIDSVLATKPDYSFAIDSAIKDAENDFSDWENAARESMIKDLTDIFF